MPRPQRARIQESHPSEVENEYESSGSEVERTPRPLQKRKRTSNVFANGDVSFTEERVPLKAVQLNDDDAERRRRRKSTRLPAPMMDIDDMAVTPRTRPGAQVNAVEQTPAVRIPLDVMNTNFEEWMKMATDNKINVANAWNFALIDYFHDMSLLRNNGDNSINFTKASCTLEGCVKIWTTRVDSVGTETGKLLSNLANESGAQGKSDDQSDNEDGEGTGPSEKRKKARSAEATLAKSYTQLKVKKLDLEFTVDPLFKKTSADFDEGGAGGLLMNHLALGMGHEGSMRVVFDSSDVAGADVVDDEQPEHDHLIELAELTGHLPSLDLISQKFISPSLRDFAFGNREVSLDDLTFMESAIPDMGGESDEDDTWEAARTVMATEPGVEPSTALMDAVDFFTGDQAVADDFDPGFSGGDPMNMDMGVDPVPEDGSPPPEAEQLSQDGTGMTEAFNPRRLPNEKELIMAMTEEEGSGMMDYFDQTFLKNWAGPEHWKLRKVVRKDLPNTGEPSSKPRREKKEAFRIDFTTPSSNNIKETAKKIFAQSTRGASLTLPATKKGKKGKEKDEQTLPDDMHFSSRQLITLFLKPSFALRMRGGSTNIDARVPGEIDEQFWAQAAADQAAGRDADDIDETMNGGVIPFSTQFFHEDYDDAPGFDDSGMGGGMPMAEPAGEGDLLAETQGLGRKVRPEAVNYAKRAKRVDVRKLKENIWKELNIVTGHKREEIPLVPEETSELTDPSEAREFTTVISGLRNSYPEEKMEEISTSFCFICLLHLANEEGLQINDPFKEHRKKSVDPGEDGDDEEVYDVIIDEDSKVGDIWSLKIYRDPNATPAA